MRAKHDIAAEIAALRDLSRDELIKRWRKIYGMDPPKGVRQELMIRAVAWHLQAKRLGGLSAETRRLLRSAKSRVEGEMLACERLSSTAVETHVNAQDADSDDRAIIMTSSPHKRPRLTPGARLLREWNGRTHIVDVIEGGYVFEAKIYPSLTAIAGKITGVHWSGPRFFGL